jgi:hypothetical protein
MASDTWSSSLLIVRAVTAALLSFALLVPANAQFWGDSWGGRQQGSYGEDCRFPHNGSTNGDDREQDNESGRSWTGACSGDLCVDSRNPVEGRGCRRCRGWRASLRPLYRVSLTESGREQDRPIARGRIRTQERIRAGLQLFTRPQIRWHHMGRAGARQISRQSPC